MRMGLKSLVNILASIPGGSSSDFADGVHQVLHIQQSSDQRHGAPIRDSHSRQLTQDWHL